MVPSRSGKHAAPDPAGGDSSANGAAPPAPPARDVGVRCWDLPFSATPPRMINPELGLPNLVSRTSQDASYSIDVTLLDTPDHRLLRAGVVLAHRVVDGRGEWYLGSTGWEPLLPTERIEPMGQAELPPDYVDLVMPLRRRATLGPVAALTCERREFAFKTTAGAVQAVLRDDRVTVSRGGLVTARYREVTLTPQPPGLEADQLRWIDQALLSAGATRVPGFPELTARLGAPATGRTDFPEPRPVTGGSPFARFVSSVVTGGVREIVRADLAVRTGDPAGAEALAEAAGELGATLQGLSAALDPDWLQGLDEELVWLAGEARAGAAREDGLAGLAAQLRRERYLHLLERLVTATRGPRLGASGDLETTEVLSTLLDSAVARFGAVADRLTADGPSADWADASSAADELRLVARAVTGVLGKPAARTVRRFRRPFRALETALDVGGVADGLSDDLETLGPVEAFERGRAYERTLGEVREAREQFVAAWTRAAAKLR
ncbi:hypothetical protein FHX74_001624 [Friedmanniella endophytica]|uniref:CHAD domain-containing protein n=1 Tax=Microlunatus kandeliicorticis TaxID=1759536 RepID=A0A7W3IRP2_9ACTN|nr:hypothetical protein [Microlunatus kandeliicorticis]MBA8794019.1 hypothetical protein [Microlunatus kandeliicorticis]